MGILLVMSHYKEVNLVGVTNDMPMELLYMIGIDYLCPGEVGDLCGGYTMMCGGKQQ